MWIPLVVAVTLQCTRAAVLSFPPVKQQVGDMLNDTQSIANQDSRYEKWADASKILYRFDEAAYSADEKSLIMKAMEQVGTDMNQCIKFREYNAESDAGLDNIYISKTLNDGTVPPTCFSFYGRVLRAAGQGQKMAIHGGKNGCMDSQREVMKIMVNVLGLRNEYNRPDRDQFMKVYPENLQAELRNSNLLTAYNASQVDTVNRPFDYHSITIPVFNKYAIANSTVFEFPTPRELPHLDRLSLDDCLGLSWMYGCDAKKCVDAYEAPAPVLKSSAADKILIELNATAASILASSEAITEVASSFTEASTPAASSAASLIASSSESSSSALPAESTQAAEQSSTQAVAIPETSATMLLTLATSASPLNVTLNDIIIPRKDANTEAPMLINTEVSAASTEATTAPVESTVAPQFKLVVIANQDNVSQAANASEATTVAPVSEASSATVQVGESSTSMAVTESSSTAVSAAESATAGIAAVEQNVTATANVPAVNVSIVAADQVPQMAVAVSAQGVNVTVADSSSVVAVNGANVSHSVIDHAELPVIQ